MLYVDIVCTERSQIKALFKRACKQAQPHRDAGAGAATTKKESIPTHLSIGVSVSGGVEPSKEGVNFLNREENPAPNGYDRADART